MNTGLSNGLNQGLNQGLHQGLNNGSTNGLNKGLINALNNGPKIVLEVAADQTESLGATLENQTSLETIDENEITVQIQDDSTSLSASASSTLPIVQIDDETDDNSSQNEIPPSYPYA
jgi:tRNA threonylcarbamoyladenosine modification (KEOPS) complex  Pcc1 subunit